MRADSLVWPGAVCALMTAGAALAQTPGASQAGVRAESFERLETIDGRVAFLRAPEPGEPLRGIFGQPFRTPDEAIEQFGTVFGITDARTQLRAGALVVDAIGYSTATYTQVHRGIPVYSGILKVHRDDTGRIHAMNGDVYDIPADLDTAAHITRDEAVDVLARAMLLEAPEIEQADLVLVDPGWYGDLPLGVHLAYHVVLRNAQGFRREAAFVDAHSATVLDRWDMIHRVKDRQIHDGQEGSGIPGDPARFEGEAATGDFDIDAAYDYYSDTYDYFFRAFGRDSIDGAGMPMVATVHSTAPGCPNAFWNGQQMVFCTGLVTDDVVGHELAHGVTQFTAGLIYQNQPGQLNESFSDIFGELIDLFNGDVAAAGAPGALPGDLWPAHPTGPGVDLPNNARSNCSPSSEGNPDGVRWLIGEDAVFGAIRDMWDPLCRSHPDRANSPAQLCQLFDVGGVHLGSGVPNHAFAILTDGKTFNGETVNGIGAIKSGAVWYRALATYLTPSSDFQDAFFAFTQAADDLVGTFPNDPRTGLPSASMFTTADASEVRAALRAVEMDGDGACGRFPDVLPDPAPGPCDTSTVLLSEGFESGAPGWTVMRDATTAYDWELDGALPHERPGSAFFVANGPPSPTSDESGTHDLLSPLIDPVGTGALLLRFTHLMQSEPHFDGGFVSVREMGSGWIDVPAEAFVTNGYTSFLVDGAEGSANPAGGTAAFSGAGGTWGTSLASLDGLLTGASPFQIRFRFAKDAASGGVGWHVDDVVVERCGVGDDCNANGVPDELESSAGAVQLVERVPTASTAYFSDIDPRPNGNTGIVAQRIELLRGSTPMQVRFWGAWYPGDVPDGGFELTIYDADPSNENLPGSPVHEEVFEAGAFEASPIGQIRFGVQVQEITLDLQSPTALDAGTYWIGISGNSPGSSDTFIWYTSWIDSGFTNIAGTSDVTGIGWGAASSFWSLSLEVTGAGVLAVPDCDSDDNGTIDVLDLLSYLSAWFPLNGQAVGPGDQADTDGSGTVDVLDLLGFLDCWFPASEGASPCP